MSIDKIVIHENALCVFRRCKIIGYHEHDPCYVCNSVRHPVFENESCPFENCNALSAMPNKPEICIKYEEHDCDNCPLITGKVITLYKTTNY
jgi:hypothetical protein